MSYDPQIRALALRTMREEAELSQPVLAEKSGMSRSLIAAVETGRSGLSIENLLLWVDICGGDLESVIPYEGTGLASRIRRLSPKRRALVVLLTETLEWSEDRLVEILTLFLESFRRVQHTDHADGPLRGHQPRRVQAEEGQD